jgi:hypothetical protein
MQQVFAAWPVRMNSQKCMQILKWWRQLSSCGIVFRRLCPDISFFQQATDFPCQQVVHSRGVKRLHRRVQHTVLKSANVERKGLGVTKVSCYSQNTLVGLTDVELSHCFSNRVAQNLRVLQNVIRGSERNSGNKYVIILNYRKNYEYTSKCCESFCSAIGNIGVISVP